MITNNTPGSTGRIVPTMPARMNPQPTRNNASFFAVARIARDVECSALRCDRRIGTPVVEGDCTEFPLPRGLCQAALWSR